MRFAIKTRPEHQTWAQMRAVWREADQIELFESAWNWDHFYPLIGDMAGSNLEGWSMLASAAAHGEAGADLIVVNPPPQATPDLLTPLADRLAPLA